ncbi:MAG TPA: hypothetical protein DC058_22500 [Planctomycetaceae bacterium]|nr:hypothetical protein [Planctomycetaceae bacterium]
MECGGCHVSAGLGDCEADAVVLEDPGGQRVGGLQWRVCGAGVSGEQAGGHAGKERKPQEVLVSEHVLGLRVGFRFSVFGFRLSVFGFRFGEPRTEVRGCGCLLLQLPQ